jgi:hypothetical protein
LKFILEKIMLKQNLQTIIVSCLVMAFLSQSAQAEQPKLTDSQLARKAQRLQTTVEKKIVQQHGLIPMFVRADDYQLPTAEDYQGAYKHRHLQGKTEEEVGMPPMHVWRAWENTSTDTAYYLYAMAYQYRTTGDPETLAICRRTFAALKYIYMLGVDNGEPGYLCKPYGGKYSNQTSSDQVQCVVWGLAAYRGIAPPEDVMALDQMCRDFADFMMKYNYYPPKGYFARSAEELRKNSDYAAMKWNRAIMVLPMLHLAWYGTGDNKYVKEISRWYNGCGEEKFPSTNKTELSGKGFDRNRDIYLSSQLMEMSPLREKQWRGRMQSVYLQNRDGILEDGTWPTAWIYSIKTKQLKPEVFSSIGGGLGRTGRSAIFAMACVSAQRWLPKENMKEDARKILSGLDEATFRFILPIDDKHPLPPEWKIESQLIDSDSLTAWLCAYWEGRHRGYW